MKLMIKKPMAGNTILLLMTFFVFLPVLSSGFLLTWDDAHYLLDNPTVRDFNLQNLLHIFLTPINNLYTPLTVSSFALEHQLFGFNPLVFHLDNLLLHICTTGLIIALARHIGLTSRASLFAGLLFAIHPMHVESVAWVTERKDCLYAFFYLLALGQYVKYVTLGARRDFYFSVGWGLLSLLSKPMAISLPLICWAMDYLLERKTSAASSIKEKLLYLICLAPFAAITLGQLPFHKIKFNMAEAILIWIWSFVFYIEKFITPWLLLPHYELPQPVLWNHPLYISAMILFLVFVYSIYRFRHNRYYVFAWAYYFLSIFFVLKTSPETSIGNLSLLGDRFMYLPCLGFCLWIGVSIDGLWQARKSKFTKAIPVCVAILFCLLAVKTYWQTKIWKNDITLWSYVIEKNPQDPLAYVNRAFAYEKQGQYDLAIADNSKAIGINPGYYVSTLAEDLPVDNEQREKIDQINTRLLNNPYYVEALRNRGKIYKTIQQNNLALKDFNEALQINPKDIEIRTLRSQIQIQK